MRHREKLARQAAKNFWKCYRATGCSFSDPVRLLTKLANQNNPDLAGKGAGALFRDIVEPLNDAFSGSYCQAYDQLFAEVVELCRRYKACDRLDQRLLDMGLDHAADICARKQRLRENSLVLTPGDQTAVQKVIVLSRVTIGADVAIVTPILSRAQELFPNAEVVFAAPSSAKCLVAGSGRIMHQNVPYQRHGPLTARLNAWLEVLSVVEAEIQGLGLKEYLIIDPDSRLTQLGLLPLGDERRYLFFPSRRFHESCSRPLGSLVAEWINRWSGQNKDTFPRLWLAPKDLQWAQKLRSALQRVDRRPIVSVSLGVGGDDTKRLGETFERELLGALVKAGYQVLLTRGVGREEAARSYRLADQLVDRGLQVQHLPKGRRLDRLTNETEAHDIVTWAGSLGAFCAAAGVSDLYVGYDSAGQHIAAALSVPTVTVFGTANTERHMQRWRPYGQGDVAVVAAAPNEQATDSVLNRVLRKVNLVSPQEKGVQPTLQQAAPSSSSS